MMYDLEEENTQLKNYIKHLKGIIKEYEKYLNVDVYIRKNSVFPRFINNHFNESTETKIIVIPERKFIVYKRYASDIEKKLKEEGIL